MRDISRFSNRSEVRYVKFVRGNVMVPACENRNRAFLNNESVGVGSRISTGIWVWYYAGDLVGWEFEICHKIM